MPRNNSQFRQRDVTRALRAAIAAGLRVTGYKIDVHTSKIEVVTGESPAQDSGGAGREPNEWDSIS